MKKKLISLVTIVLIFSQLSIELHANRYIIEAARRDAKIDYEKVKDWDKFVLGACLGPIGVLYSFQQSYHREIRPRRLIGKSPEYILEYAEAYNKQRQKYALGKSVFGFGISATCLFGLTMGFFEYQSIQVGK